MTIIPYSSSRDPSDKRIEDIIERILCECDSFFNFTDVKLNLPILKSIKECLEQPFAISTLDYWNQKLQYFNNARIIRQDFLLTKLLELGAFHLGYLQGENYSPGIRKNDKTLNNETINKPWLHNRDYKSNEFISDICFVIPIHLQNSKALGMFVRLLFSLLDMYHPPSQIIVINDGSPIEINLHQSIKEKILLKRFSKRRGPAFSRNRGAEIACDLGYDFIVFSDYDMIFLKNWTTILIRALRGNNRDIISGTNHSFGKTWWDWYHNVNGSLNGRIFRDSRFLLYATTAALAVKSKVFDKITFNEKFTDAAGEDIDFCLQARRKGLRIAFNESLVARHDYGYTGSLLNDVEIFISRFIRYGSSEPLLSSIHPDYCTDFYRTNEISIMKPILIPKSPFG